LLSLFLLARSPLWEPALIPVVVPDFILLDFTFPDFILEPVAPGPTLPSLDAPGAGCVCADAIAVAPNSEATARAEIASLARLRDLLLWIDDAGVKTCDADLGSDRALTCERIGWADRPRPTCGTPPLRIALTGMRHPRTQVQSRSPENNKV
jgi:hypothetical protein